MKRIRKGKDIKVRCPVRINGESIDLSRVDLSVELKDPGTNRTSVPFVIEGNDVVFSWKGTDQRFSGKYTLTLWANHGRENQSCVDYCNFVELVNSTCEEDSATCGFEDECMTMNPCNIIVGVQGASAYQTAVRNGFIGSEDEWLESLRGETGAPGNIIYPTFYVDDDMELVMQSDYEETRFQLNDDEGELTLTV